MASPDFSVPDWIKPPSPAEQERIDEASVAASRKAYGMIRRGIGVNRMQADAQEAIKSGADPVTARQTALLNNAHLIFGDNPEEIANIVNSQQANQIRDRALLQTKQHQETMATMQALGLRQRKEIADNALAQTTKSNEAKLAQSKVEEEGRNKRALLGTQSRENIAAIHESSAAARKVAGATGQPQFFEEGGQRYVWFPGGKTARKVGANKTEFVNQHLNAFVTRFGNKAMDKMDEAWDRMNPPEPPPVELPPKTKGGPVTTTEQGGFLQTDEPPVGFGATPNKPIPQSEWKVDNVYRGKDGKLKAFKGMDKNGKPIWEEQ